MFQFLMWRQAPLNNLEEFKDAFEDVRHCRRRYGS